MDPVEYDIRASGYAAAFRSVKAAKNVFWWLVGLALLAQVCSFVAVEFGGVIGPFSPPADEPVLAAVQSSETQPATSQPTAGRVTIGEVGKKTLEKAQRLESQTFAEEILKWLLPATKFFGFVACVLLVLTFLMASQLSLLGRLGGVVGFVSGLFWALILLAMVTPWQQVLSAPLARGAMFNLGDLVARGAAAHEQATFMGWVFYYGIFLAYPALALLVWLLVQTKFARGYKDSSLASLGTIPLSAPESSQGEQG